MKKNYGSLEIKSGKDTKRDPKSLTYFEYKRPVFIVSGFQPSTMLARIIPDSWADKRGQIQIDVNVVNTEHIDWLMKRYPLEIKHPRKWKWLLNDLSDLNKRKEKILKLEFPNPKESFQGTLREFQKQALDFLQKTNGNALIADEMGLGKTVETLAYLSTVEEAFPTIIVAPLIVLRNWKSEIKRFLKMKIPQTVIEDQPSDPRCYLIRKGKSEKLPPAEFYIINYELVAKRLDDLIKLNPTTLILDEVQNLRNMGTGKFNAIDQLAAHPHLKYRIGLSGTPIYNRGSEIWGIVDILQKGILGSYYEFCRTYCWTDYRGKGHVFEEKQKALSELLQESVMIRRRKKDVLKELPEKTRYKQIIGINSEQYEEEIQKIFSEIDDAKEAVNNASKDERKTKVFQLNAMYQKAISSERQSAGIAKAPYVVKYIKELMELDEKIVVFCHHRIVHEILMKGLSEFNPCHIIGGQTDNQRQDAIDTFQNTDPGEIMSWNKRNLLVAGIRAGNVGINLTAASYVIFAELDWSPAIHRQAEDRLHRIGQRKAVFAHYLVGEETLDDTIVNVLVDKALEIDAVMGDEHQDYDQEKAKVILEKLQSRILKIKSK